MEGVILFADDQLLNYSFNESTNTFHQSEENKLYKVLAETNEVLGLQTRESVERSINTVGTFTAIILDWQFTPDDTIEFEEDDDETASLVSMPSSVEDKTFKLLMNNEFHSLIYVYSSAKEAIEAKYGEALKQKFQGRIQFRDKTNLSNPEVEAESIIRAINEWKEANKKIFVPVLWSYSINKSVKNIFSKLFDADENWVKELYMTAKDDGVSPSVEVINLFQNILSEKIIQDESLRNSIDELCTGDTELSTAEDFAKLVRILYYGYTSANDPIMTGDILKIGIDHYAIIISPECDMRHITGKPEASYEVLTFKKGDYKKSEFRLNGKIKADPLIEKAQEISSYTFNAIDKRALKKIINDQIDIAEDDLRINAFTQTNKPRVHLLPCFEFEVGNFSGIARIDFRSGLSLLPSSSVNTSIRIGKLNSPYIQELRQRYLSYKGRVGVAGSSKKLKEWLISKQ